MRIITSLLILLFTLPVIVTSQTMIIQKKDGTTDKYNISEIECISFSEPTPQTSFCPDEVNYMGKIYQTVQIGDQCWLKQNLDVGTMIDRKQSQTNNGVIEKYCADNDPANCKTYGGMYQWDEAMQYVNSVGAKGICPEGWHIPSTGEMELLETYLNDNRDALLARGQLTGTDISGFSALLGGYRSDGGGTMGIGVNTYLWSSSQSDERSSIALNVYSKSNKIWQLGYPKSYGLCIRCIKD